MALATRLVDTSRDMTLAPVERWFVYMPFEHSERLLDQYEAVRLFERLAANGLEGPLDWARRHFDIIKRFGRFPHRNAILGRESTPAELEFLQQPGIRLLTRRSQTYRSAGVSMPARRVSDSIITSADSRVNSPRSMASITFAMERVSIASTSPSWFFGSVLPLSVAS